MASLNDGRQVYYGGRRVESVSTDEMLSSGVKWVAGGYDRYFSSEPGARNEVLSAPANADEFKERVHTLEAVDLLLHLTYQSSMALLTAAERIAEGFPEGADRVRRYVEWCAAEDLRMVQCITDSKGDRSLPPGGQPDPDQYLRIVERREDGIVIRGAKLHISGAPLAHELMVMPTKRMKPGEDAYAVACAIPVNAPGVKVIATLPADHGSADPRDVPVSYGRVVPEGFVVFDDVFVPNDRIFLDGQTALSAEFAHSLGLWERLGATGSHVVTAETMVGLAQLVCEANGTTKIGHVREKLTDLVLHATLLRGTYETALANSTVSERGVVTPDELFTNAATAHAATGWSTVCRILLDLSGGSVITAPSMADLDNPELTEILDKYMSGASGMPGRQRLQLLHLIRNLAADAHAGWVGVTTLQAGGGLHALRTVMRGHFDFDSAKRTALAHLDHVSGAVS